MYLSLEFSPKLQGCISNFLPVPSNGTCQHKLKVSMTTTKIIIYLPAQFASNKMTNPTDSVSKPLENLPCSFQHYPCWGLLFLYYYSNFVSGSHTYNISFLIQINFVFIYHINISIEELSLGFSPAS